MINTARSVFIFTLLVSGYQLFSQQDAQFTHYMFNQQYYNPGYTGMSAGPVVTAIHRSQWLGYDGNVNTGGAPNTQLVSVNYPLTQIKGAGVGLYVSNDHLGPVNNMEFQASFAYQLKVQGGILSVGVQAGMYSSGLDFDELIFVDPSDDLAGLSGKESQIKPDVGFGVYYKRGNIFGGISANHLTKPVFDFGEDQVVNRLSRQYYLVAGYEYRFNPQLTFTPTFLLKSAGLNTYNFDLSVIGKYEDKLWAGLSYRQSESASAMVGYNLLSNRSLSLAYAFDFVVNDQSSKEPTSHELMLVYHLKSTRRPKVKRSKIIRTPRYRYQ